MKHNPTLAIRAKRERASRQRKPKKPPRKLTKAERILTEMVGVQRGIHVHLSLMSMEARKIERQGRMIAVHLENTWRSIHGVETAIRDATKLYDDSQAFPEDFGIEKDDGDDP